MHQRAWVLAMALAAVAMVSAPARGAIAGLRVMSFNIRVGSADDGVNSWVNPYDGPDRRDLVVTTIKNYNPDILGIQEDLGYQGDYIKNHTTGYSMFRRSVNNDGTGERIAILYKTSRFTSLRRGTFWLSPTPDEPASQFGDAQFAREVNWLELSDNQNGGYRFIIMNTHWEHGSTDKKEAVRLASATVMRQKMAELGPNLPIIFTGDFNADQGADSYRRMTSRDGYVETPVDEKRWLIDTYRNLHTDAATASTASGFDGTGGSKRLDWILNTEDFKVLESNIDRTSYDGRYPSDHFPINAIVQPVAIPEPALGALLGVLAAALPRGRRR